MTPQNHDAWLKQVTVPCPTRSAAVGAPCTRPGRDGEVEIRGTHQARKRAAATRNGPWFLRAQCSCGWSVDDVSVDQGDILVADHANEDHDGGAQIRSEVYS